MRSPGLIACAIMLACVLAVWGYVLRFDHPELTETQLFLAMWPWQFFGALGVLALLYFGFREK